MTVKAMKMKTNSKFENGRSITDTQPYTQREVKVSTRIKIELDNKMN